MNERNSRCHRKFHVHSNNISEHQSNKKKLYWLINKKYLFSINLSQVFSLFCYSVWKFSRREKSIRFIKYFFQYEFLWFFFNRMRHANELTELRKKINFNLSLSFIFYLTRIMFQKFILFKLLLLLIREFKEFFFKKYIIQDFFLFLGYFIYTPEKYHLCLIREFCSKK